MELSSLLAKFRGASSEDSAKRDARKAHRFFEHAEAIADARNYDYAIECYISGLKHDPDNVNQHEALRQVALRRKVAGGKPTPLTERFRLPGPTAIDRMLHVERLWSKDPLNVRLMRAFMQRTTEADEAEADLHLGEVAYWVGDLILEFASQSGKPDKRTLLATRDLFARVKAYDKAVQTCKMALRIDPDNDKLLKELKDLEAERTMQEGGYSDVQQVQEGGFRNFVRDSEKQEALDQEDRIVKRQSDVDQTIERRRAEYEEDPQDTDKLNKFVNALLQKEEDESEQEAIELLQHAWDQTGQYRWKMRIGDIHMKRYNRHLRKLRQQIDNAEDATELKQQMQQLQQKKHAFELEEYQERVKNYPTDQGLRFELGKRLYQAGKVDEAIGAFQQAKADPKHRAAAHEHLGTCYIQKGWYEEAIDTLRTGVDMHPDESDRLGLELRYLLMDVLERNARQNSNAEQAREAQKVASQILQTKIDYRDIQQRIEKIRELVSELQAKASE